MGQVSCVSSVWSSRIYLPASLGSTAFCCTVSSLLRKLCFLGGRLNQRQPVSPGSLPVGVRYRTDGPGPLVKQCPALLSLTIRCPRPGASQASLLISFELLTIPPPTTALPFLHGRFRTLLHRRELPRLSSGQTSPVGRIAFARSRVRAFIVASPTGLAESSSLALRTGHSSQVALHLSSRKRSYHS